MALTPISMCWALCIGTWAQVGRAQMIPGPKWAGPKRDLGPNGPGPNGTRAQIPKGTLAQNLSVVGFRGKNCASKQNRHGHMKTNKILFPGQNVNPAVSGKAVVNIIMYLFLR